MFAVKALAWMIFVPVCAFIALFVIGLTMHTLSPTETYASSIGTTVDQCQRTAAAFYRGQDRIDLMKKCGEQVPKTAGAATAATAGQTWTVTPSSSGFSSLSK